MRRRRRHSNPPRSRLLKAAIIGGFVLLLCTTISVPLLILYNRLFGPALMVAAPPATAQSAGQPQCGATPIDYVMLVGSDDHYETGFADAIRVLRVDHVTLSATVLSVPRDLWVAIPGLQQHGIVENRIKSAYTYGNSFDVPGGGPSLLAQTLIDSFGFEINHYMVINFTAFETSIDAIGGVDVAVPAQVAVPGQADYFAQGLQHMDGATALRYARLRGGDSDLYRVNRQTDVLLAVREKVTSPGILHRVPGLILSIHDIVLSDMSLADLSTLLCVFRKIDSSAISFREIGPDMLERDFLFEQEVLLPDYPAIRKLVQEFNAGNLQ